MSDYHNLSLLLMLLVAANVLLKVIWTVQYKNQYDNSLQTISPINIKVQDIL